MKMMKVKGKNTYQYVELFGDPNKQLEPAEFRIYFPFGSVSLARTSDGEYWAHVSTLKDDDQGITRHAGSLVHARLDIEGKSSSDANLGDFNNPELYHAAIRIGKGDNHER